MLEHSPRRPARPPSPPSPRRAQSARLLASAAALALCLTGCGFFPSGEDPLVVAHRGAAGYWPDNSRSAILGSLAAGYPGIEFDIVLTADGIPVLAHDPWIDTELCTLADGTALTADDDVLIQELTLAELHATYRCGAIRDPAHPEAELVADTHMTLDELITAAASYPATVLHFDTKYLAGSTPPAADFADAIIDRWTAAALPNPWYVSSTEEEMVGAFADKGVEDITLIWPRFTEEEPNVLTGLRSELLQQLGLENAISVAERYRANALGMQYRVTDRRIVDAANQQGLRVQLWTLNDVGALDAFCGWPVHALITDYPERAPCL